MPKPIPVTIEIPSNPELGRMPAAIENIGDMIDQNEHMAVLIGHVENPRGDLRVGQFVTGSVALAPEEGVVEMPTRAVVEDGTESIVFVQENPERVPLPAAPRVGGAPLLRRGPYPQPPQRRAKGRRPRRNCTKGIAWRQAKPCN